MSLLVQLAIAAAIAIAGFAAGVRWHVGVDAQRELQAREIRETDARQQRRFNDEVGARHAAAVDRLSTQLGDARAQIAALPGRPCLDAGTVGLLNAIGSDGAVRAAAAEPSSAPAAAAADRHDAAPGATDRDVGAALATCRTRYAQLESQLNQILDVEDRRHPPAPP